VTWRRKAAGTKGAVLAGVTAAGVASAAWCVLGRRPPADDRWQRRNFRDREVTLLLGPAVGVGALAGVAATGRPGRRAALLVVCSAAVVGGYDDLYGDRHARGLGGHARALREGRVTTGMVKLVALTVAAGLGSASRHRRVADAALGTVLVAGGANLINLFDLRPGRAAKVGVVAAAALSGSDDRQGRAIAAVAAGVALAAMPADLGERAMLGDCGASTLGALLGWSAASGGSRRRRTGLAAVVVALTAGSERVSFSAVIDRWPVLRSLDRLGRQPA
jgi:UDP-GlcNAc:undecaprenyl-phosphate GlcNAc-1-phosphate transferase